MVVHPHLTVSRRGLSLPWLRHSCRNLPAENGLVAPGQRETLDLSTLQARSQIPIAQFPSAGLHHAQGIPENSHPALTLLHARFPTLTQLTRRDSYLESSPLNYSLGRSSP